MILHKNTASIRLYRGVLMGLWRFHYDFSSGMLS